MNRRKLLKVAGASAGALGLAGVGGRYLLLPPSPSRTLAGVDELAARLYASLDDETRAAACVPYDHPLRQYHNRGLWAGGLRVWRNLSWEQRALVVDLFHAGLSAAGRERVPAQYFVRWPGVHLLSVLFCGEPARPPYAVHLTGPHLNLRLGGASREGAAFGGPQVYGDQRGNGRPGLPGNVYRYQLELGTRLFEALSPGEHERATYPEEPPQTQIELRGTRAEPPGLALADASEGARQAAARVVDGILENYPREDADYARDCLDAAGGVASLSVSRYLRGEDGDAGPNQIFRLEGPNAVFHFRGHPHLHAFLNVGRDGDAPLSVGELLGENPEPLEGAAVKALFEEVLRAETGAQLAYYEATSVVSRLRAGAIRSGDVYCLESWNDDVVTLELDVDALRPAMAAALERSGVTAGASGRVTVATSAYVADELAAEKLGRVRAREAGRPLREAAVDHLRRHGFERRG
ncbi:MAG: DUF3500 domain-containing protein [Planctomycetota bacterium]